MLFLRKSLVFWVLGIIRNPKQNHDSQAFCWDPKKYLKVPTWAPGPPGRGFESVGLKDIRTQTPSNGRPGVQGSRRRSREVAEGPARTFLHFLGSPGISWKSYGPQGLCFPIGKQRIYAKSRPYKGGVKDLRLKSPSQGGVKDLRLKSPLQGDVKDFRLKSPLQGDVKDFRLKSPLQGRLLAQILCFPIGKQRPRGP